ncbi:MAG: polysaccharide deacetylase family protein [Candidatus Omnitrophica bacterium]|nr:polysaccharide deacetylase family protein [Candidatus Omnitrophota bacterium]
MRRLRAYLFVVFLAIWASFFIFLNQRYYPVILMYHSINPSLKGTPTVSKETFIRQMEFIKRHHYKVVSLEKMAGLIKAKKPLYHLVAITFDDGDEDNLEAAKILARFHYPATIFMIVKNIDKEGFLSQAELKYILQRTPVSIGSHTLTHTYLPSLSYFQLEKEIVLSKMRLEDMLGVKIKEISYPVGGFNEDVLRIVENAGYCCGCATNRGRGKSVYALKRIKVGPHDLGFRLWIKLSGFYNAFRRYKSPY